MRSAKQIVADAQGTGRIWLEGEMEIPVGLLIEEAAAIMCRIAEDCGYLVTRYNGCRSMLQVTCPYQSGYYVLDWMDADRRGPTSIIAFREEQAWLIDPVAAMEANKR